MSVVPTTHIYHRLLDPHGQDSLAKLARLVRPGSSVLDLGAGPGILGRYLAEHLECIVDGVEYNPAAAAEAAPWYRRLECADLEQVVLTERFVGCRYDFIVCADILEHLRQPGDLLAQLPGLLAPGGHVLASVPNVAHAGLIAELLAGEFRYRVEGLLDETHLRFFTLRSLTRSLARAGLQVVAVDAALLGLRESEFADCRLDALPPALVRGLLGRPEALVYQFIVSAQAAAEVGSVECPALECPPPELRFACQLFWRGPEGEYRANDSSTTWGQIGAARQCLTLPIPVLPTPPQTLRLDFADRPGLMRLYRLALRDGAGQSLWEWDGRRDSLADQPSRQLVIAEPGWSAEGMIVLLAGEDPHLELPVPASALAGLRKGGELVADLSWPMSLDYLALVQHCVPRRDAETAQAALIDRARVSEAREAVLASRNAELEAAVASWSTNSVRLETELAAATAARSELERRLSELTDQSNRLATEVDLLRRSWRERLWTGLRRRWRG